MTRHKEHWTATAERVTSGDHRILGEDDLGYLYVPATVTGPSGEPYWHGVYNPRNPRHWQYWLRSRLTNRIAWLEAE